MAPILTLHHGDAEAAYVEHPIEVARKALLAAADLEDPRWAGVMSRFAGSLPPRGTNPTRGAVMPADDRAAQIAAYQREGASLAVFTAQIDIEDLVRQDGTSGHVSYSMRVPDRARSRRWRRRPREQEAE